MQHAAAAVPASQHCHLAEAPDRLAWGVFAVHSNDNVGVISLLSFLKLPAYNGGVLYTIDTSSATFTVQLNQPTA